LKSNPTSRSKIAVDFKSLEFKGGYTVLSLEQQHLFDHLEIIARLTCEICFEEEDIYFNFLPAAEQTSSYYSDVFQSVVRTFSQKWRVLGFALKVHLAPKRRELH
jgi:hypothetical protein